MKRKGKVAPKAKEEEIAPSSDTSEAEKVPEIEDIAAEKPMKVYPKIRVRLASTGTFLAAMRDRQLASGEVEQAGQIKVNQWTFSKAQIKTIYVTPEVSTAIKNGIFEVLNPSPPEEVDES
jgi:hypothetical protein